MFSVRPYYTPNLCALMIGLGAITCEDPGCRAVHGWTLSLQFMWWGVDFEFIRP